MSWCIVNFSDQTTGDLRRYTELHIHKEDGDLCVYTFFGVLVLSAYHNVDKKNALEFSKCLFYSDHFESTHVKFLCTILKVWK